MLPTPPKHAELLRRAREAAAKGHVGASLAQRGAEALGARVDIFWSGNDAFFPGTVSGYDAASLAHAVTYDDGDRQWLRLWREGEVVRVLSLGGEGEGGDEVAKEAEEAEAVDGEGAAKEAEALDEPWRGAASDRTSRRWTSGTNGTEAKEARRWTSGRMEPRRWTSRRNDESSRRNDSWKRRPRRRRRLRSRRRTAVEEATAAAPPPPRRESR